MHTVNPLARTRYFAHNSCYNYYICFDSGPEHMSLPLDRPRQVEIRPFACILAHTVRTSAATESSIEYKHGSNMIAAKRKTLLPTGANLVRACRDQSRKQQQHCARFGIEHGEHSVKMCQKHAVAGLRHEQRKAVDRR